MMTAWIPAERIEQIVILEPALVLLFLVLGTWVFYVAFLRHLSLDRHRNLRELFKNLAVYVFLASGFLATYLVMVSSGVSVSRSGLWLERLTPYLGLAALLLQSLVFIKTIKILAFEYLFLSSPKTGVPVLLVNLITLFFSILLVAWFATSLFGVRLAPLLATSAALSIVLGLALQDTLGNLIAGVSLQIDKPYELEDWIEVQNGAQKWVGKVYEITWRATILVSFGDEILTIPNRVMAQSEIVNYSAHLIPFCRTLTLRVRYLQPIEEIRVLLIAAAREVSAIEIYPAPVVTIGELHESGVVIRLTYSIRDYGKHTVIATQVYEKILERFVQHGIEIAQSRLEINNLNPVQHQI